MLRKPFFNGHYANRILITAFAAQLVFVAIDTFFDLPYLLTSWYLILWMATVLDATITLIQHDRGPLCEHCMAAMPLDPAARAERYRRSLTTFHWMADRRRRSIPVFAVALVLALIGINTGLIPFNAVALLFAGPGIWIFLSTARHSQLQPWCPRCRRRGDSEEEPADGPQPDLALNN